MNAGAISYIYIFSFMFRPSSLAGWAYACMCFLKTLQSIQNTSLKRNYGKKKKKYKIASTLHVIFFSFVCYRRAMSIGISRVLYHSRCKKQIKPLLLVASFSVSCFHDTQEKIWTPTRFVDFGVLRTCPRCHFRVIWCHVCA